MVFAVGALAGCSAGSSRLVAFAVLLLAGALLTFANFDLLACAACVLDNLADCEFPLLISLVPILAAVFRTQTVHCAQPLVLEALAVLLYTLRLLAVAFDLSLLHLFLLLRIWRGFRPSNLTLFTDGFDMLSLLLLNFNRGEGFVVQDLFSSLFWFYLLLGWDGDLYDFVRFFNNFFVSFFLRTFRFWLFNYNVLFG